MVEPAAYRPAGQGPAEYRAGDVRLHASTPLVIAMPEPMAKALGWPDTPDRLGRRPRPGAGSAGLGSKGHPEWGRFTLGKTNPTISTSGLAATIGTLVAATGTSSDLTEAALERPEVQQYLKDVESAVIHYGDTTLTYLSNLQRADDAGLALGYVSAVAVEEKSVLDYNAGNPEREPRNARRAPRRRSRSSRSTPRRARSTATARTSSWTPPGLGREAGGGAGLPGIPVAARATADLHRHVLPDRRPAARRADHSSPYLIADGVRSPSTLRGPRSCRRPVPLGGQPEERESAGADGCLGIDVDRLRVRRQDQARPREERRDDRAGSAGRHRPGRLLGVHHRPADADDDHRGPGARGPLAETGSRSPTRSRGSSR